MVYWNRELPQSEGDHLPGAIMDSRGRLTVPKIVRDRLGLKSGDQVYFEFWGDSVRLGFVRRKSLGDLIGSLPATRSYPGKEAEREAMFRAAARLH